MSKAVDVQRFDPGCHCCVLFIDSFTNSSVRLFVSCCKVR